MVVIASRAAPIVRAAATAAAGRFMGAPPNAGAFDCAVRLYNDTTDDKIAANGDRFWEDE
jgi:hypothetical protein